MENLIYQFELIRAIRKFFEQYGFTDVITPPIVENPGMETHIHPFNVQSTFKKSSLKGYLQTSPEFAMKELLAKNDELHNIFTIGYCFRDEPTSEIHRPQFVMLEWYRKNSFYTQIMNDVEKLLSFLSDELTNSVRFESFPRVTVRDIIFEYEKFDILDFLEGDDLYEKLKKDFSDVPLPESKCSWDDYFFLFFLNKVEPHFKNYPYLLLYEFPAPLAALSTIKKEDPRVCERFEVYLKGIELCNCFNEATDYLELKKRFEFQASEKKELYGYEVPWPTRFMQVMQEGYPTSSGIALGVERLLYSLQGIKKPFFD